MTSFVGELRSTGNVLLVRIVAIAAIGGLLFGYDTGVISGALLYIKPDLHPGTFGQEAIVSSLLLGAIVGAVMSGYLADAISRKWTKVVSGCIYIIGALGCAFSTDVLMQKGRRDEATHVLERLRDRDKDADVPGEVDDIEQAIATEGSTGVRDLLKPNIRPLLVVGLSLAIFQQFVGVNTVIYYAPTILAGTGLTNSSSVTQTVFIGITNVVFTVVAVLLLDRVGRRKLLLTGTVGLTVGLAVLGAYFASPTLQHDAPLLALGGLLLFIASFAIGLGPVFWLLISEIFPQGVRSAAMSVSTVGNWAANFIVGATFLTLSGAITRQGTFFLYAGLSIIAIVVFAVRVPETKDRSLEDIQQELTGTSAGASGKGR